MAEKAKTIVEYFAEHERYRCGYCGNKDTNYSHGMWAHTMNVQDYQDLLDRGWRRSGKYTYKPTMSMTCCPQYPIRCEVLNFKLRKSHKKVLKKVNKFLIHGIKPSTDNNDPDEGQSRVEPATENKIAQNFATSEGQLEHMTSEVQSDKVPSVTSEVSPAPSGGNLEKEPMVSEGESAHQEKKESTASNEESVNHRKEARKPRPGSGQDPNKPPCKKAKDIRREMKLAKLAAKGVTAENLEKNAGTSKQPESKTLEDILNEPKKAEKCAHKLEIRLVRSNPQSEEFRDSLTESHGVYHRYQMSIHHDPADKPVMKQYKRFLIDSPLEVRLVRSHPKAGEFKSTLSESYNVYKKYQMTIHKDTPSECAIGSYTNFLVDSPLEEEHEEGGLPDGYGSFHQQYLLDGKIICVGVLDILPSLVSSKYLYYDPDYSFLSLGTYSALQEIAFIRSLHKYSKTMLYYYMGFYIHSCPKMKYKGQYFPSYLLCPQTYTWHPVEKCAPMLDKNKYSRFADADQVEVNGGVELSSVRILFSRQMMTYQIYKDLSRGQNNDEEEVKEYAGFVGKKCAHSLLLFRK